MMWEVSEIMASIGNVSLLAWNETCFAFSYSLLSADLWALSAGAWLKTLQSPETPGSRLEASVEEENMEVDQFDIFI